MNDAYVGTVQGHILCTIKLNILPLGLWVILVKTGLKWNIIRYINGLNESGGTFSYY